MFCLVTSIEERKPDCGTNWADFQILDGTSFTIRAEVHKKTNNDGGSMSGFGNVVMGSRDWCQMVYSPNDQACAAH